MTYNPKQNSELQDIRNKIKNLNEKLSQLEAKYDNEEKLNEENEKSKKELKKHPFLATMIPLNLIVIIYGVYCTILIIAHDCMKAWNFEPNTIEFIGTGASLIVPIALLLGLQRFLKHQQLIQYEPYFKFGNSILTILASIISLYLPESIVFSSKGVFGVVYIASLVNCAISYYGSKK
ncbi:hypothetical protein [Anaerosinus gibii]|uniref:Uncharacterized protein n=1 Tax=Selenobaculum gibii TaxID=3054208 RepID=A0A9Y2AGT2_9FIRM|nr:hypothetical protein [Selenobaculum gbiensis]WIW69852.1 hypothetical protein P3F81_07960 [Selenobaculum gbiensis]